MKHNRLLNKEPTQPPNILLILCDDLGVDDLGFAGNLVARTPNIDALAGESATFNSFTVNPVCAPSRATLLTGRHFLRTGVSHVHGGKDFIHLDEILLPERLREVGYATGMWGKWHNGTADGYLPWQRGFDEVYMADLYRHRCTTGTCQDETRVNHEDWADRVIANYAIDFIHRNRHQPFFAFLSTMTPHGPHDAPEDLVASYEARGFGPAPARLFAMIESLDMQVGRIISQLEQEELTRNTLVLFLSDNGPNHDEHFTPEERALRKVQGLRGWKGDIWEGGVRAPLLMRWPDHIRPQTVVPPVQMADLFPTLCHAASVATPLLDSEELDGHSLWPILDGTSDPVADRTIFNYANPGWPPSPHLPYSVHGIRDEYRPIPPPEKPTMDPETQVISIRRGRFKLLLNAELNTHWVDHPQSDYRLIDLHSDPQERLDTQTQFPDVFVLLRQDLLNWFCAMREEPHSFTAPVWRIRTDRPTTIQVTGAWRLSSDLKNTVHCLVGWSRKNAAADYTIDVAVSGYFRILLDASADLASRLSIRIYDGDAEHENSVVMPVFLSTGSHRLQLRTHTLGGNNDQILTSFRFEPLGPERPVSL